MRKGVRKGRKRKVMNEEDSLHQFQVIHTLYYVKNESRFSVRVKVEDISNGTICYRWTKHWNFVLCGLRIVISNEPELTEFFS